MRCRFLKPTFQNQCSLILLSFLFQFPCQDHKNGKHCQLIPQSSRITLRFTSSNICIDTVGLLFLHKFVFSQMCITHNGCENHSNLWCSGKWKIDLEIKKMKVYISTIPRQNYLTGPCHHPKGRDKLLIRPVEGMIISKFIALVFFIYFTHTINWNVM